MRQQRKSGRIMKELCDRLRILTFITQNNGSPLYHLSQERDKIQFLFNKLTPRSHVFKLEVTPHPALIFTRSAIPFLMALQLQMLPFYTLQMTSSTVSNKAEASQRHYIFISSAPIVMRYSQLHRGFGFTRAYFFPSRLSRRRILHVFPGQSCQLQS